MKWRFHLTKTLKSPGDWASCFEWCLSKPNHCTQLWVEVRRNGSYLLWGFVMRIAPFFIFLMSFDDLWLLVWSLTPGLGLWPLWSRRLMTRIRLSSNLDLKSRISFLYNIWYVNVREIKTSLMLRETPCEPDKPEDDCEEVNQKFLERCRRYRHCPEQGEEPVFVCQQKQCVSRWQPIYIFILLGVLGSFCNFSIKISTIYYVNRSVC